jgi:PAS domain S-box-containing protein
LQASAGLYTHLDGPHSRVPVGQYKIGLIAQERKPHLTNTVADDPRVSDQEWARREGMIAFAGYPLLVEDRLVGVMAMFARQPLSDATMEAMASVANGIALGVERKIAEEERRQQQEWLRVTLASIGDAVIATDTQGRVTFLNGVAQELTAWKQEEAHGQPLEAVFAILNEQTRQPVENPVEKVLRDGVVVGLGNHTVLIAKDGTERPIDDSAAPIRDSSGKIIGVVLIFRDVTEHRRAIQEVRSSEARKSAILETALDCVITMDHEGKVVEFNPAAEKTFGYRRAEVIGNELASFIIPHSLREQHRRGMAHLLKTGEGPVLGQRLELPALRADGIEFPVEIAITRIAVDGPPMFTAYLRDISERSRAEAALGEAERRFKAVFNQQFQFMAILTPDGTVLDANETCFSATGIEPERVLGRPFWETPWWDRLPVIQEQLKRHVSEAVGSGGPVTGEIEYSQADGTIRHATVVVTGLRDESGRVTSIIVEGHDDTERRQHETALQESEEKLRLLADTIPQLAWMAGPDGYVFWYNRRWYEYTGTTPDQMEGWGWQSLHDPDTLPKVIERWKDSITNGEPFEMVFPLKGADNQFRSFLTRVNPLRDEENRILYWFGTNTDISEIKQMEEALRDADRRKDEFLATLAHELRNPLAPIRNSLQILKMPRVDAATVQQTRDMMERQVHHLVRLVDDLLDVSRVMRGKIELRREPVELASVVARAVEIVQPLIEVQGHRLNLSLPSESLVLDADPVRLAQVVGNLLTNSAKYSETNGNIWLTARRERDQAVLSVRDTGIGIAPDMLPHVFELFVQADHTSTKAQGGLGIGLTLVKNLVEMHGGTVEAKSAGLGKGCEFIIRLPLMVQESQQPNEKQNGEQKDTPPSGHRLLVVDDNKDAAVSLAMLLRLQGHEVRVAHDGPSALEISKSYQPGVIFLDIGMPGMDGYEVARRIRQHPGLEKVVLAALTGWGQEEDRRRTAEAGFDYHLVKPPEPKAVESLLAELKRPDGS